MRRPAGPFGAVIALAQSGLGGVWKSKLIWLAVGFSAVHIGVRATIITVVALFAPDNVDFVLNARFMRDTIMLQATVPAVIVLGTVGSRVAARDRMMGGLEFLLSKPLPRWGYAAGRALTPLLAATLLLFLPAVLLAVLMWLLIPDLPAGAGELLWGQVAMAGVFTLGMGPLAAGVGTLVDNPRSATGLWLALVWATIPLSGIADQLEVDWWWTFAPIVLLHVTARTLVDLPFPGPEVAWGWLGVALLIALPLWALHHRTKEVSA